MRDNDDLIMCGKCKQINRYGDYLNKKHITLIGDIVMFELAECPVCGNSAEILKEATKDE